MKARDLVVGQAYTFRGRQCGVLVSVTVVAHGGAGFQEPVYQLVFERQQMVVDWDVEFSPA